MKMSFPELVRDKATIERLEVQSFEMNVYLVKVTVGGIESMLYNGTGNLFRFHSTQEVRDTFEGLTVKEAVMVHESPYDEMIGNPPKSVENMRVPFSMTQPY